MLAAIQTEELELGARAAAKKIVFTLVMDIPFPFLLISPQRPSVASDHSHKSKKPE